MSPGVPPPALPGLRPEWSRTVEAVDCAGVRRTWHLLDTHATGAGPPPRLTLLCIHGNPTWSYAFRRLLAEAPPDIRVVAVDHLDMGWSERTGMRRTLADRIDDLDGLTAVLGLTEGAPVVTVAHDWGGPISLGWALRHVDRLAGVVLMNTAVHQPRLAAAPVLIRLARTGWLRRAVTERSPVFVRGTTALSRLRRGDVMPVDVARAYAAPYAGRTRRRAVGDFVADIPLEADHPSRAELDRIAAGLSGLAEVPVLLLWGPDDPVFSDRYLRDLRGRLPHADVHRYEGARHLVMEDAPGLVPDLLRWVDDRCTPRGHADVHATAAGVVGGTDPESLLDEVRARASDDSPAVVELASGTRTTWRDLADRIDACARGLLASGVRRGDRVAMLVTPGADLIVAIYACWAIGAVAVVADAGLGVRGMRRALRGAHIDHVVAIAPGLALARTLAVPGLRVRAGSSGPADRLATTDLASLEALGRRSAALPDALAQPDDDAVVAFTSGATGPAKGVVYTQARLLAQRAVLREHYRITRSDALVAAFAPWSVLGPALGIPSALPDMDVRRASTLTAPAVADATRAVAGTLMWASPAALRGVASTSGDLTADDRAALHSIRLLLAAGAPVPPHLLAEVAAVMPGAEARTPYGMTEALPLTDIRLADIIAAPDEEGVCVGHPVGGVEIGIAPLDAHGRAGAVPTAPSGVTGEICVRAAHTKDRYDALWATQSRSSVDAWHRTGDVGHLDVAGRLWVEGRMAHVIATADGPVTPVGAERRAETLPAVRQAACVGVGPPGAAVVVMVVVPTEPPGRDGLADPDLTAGVRARVGERVAAVLSVRALPVDIRHQSKIDRRAVADWADGVLAGGRIRRLV